MIELIQDFFSDWGWVVIIAYLIMVFLIRKILGKQITKGENWDKEQVEYYKNQHKKSKDESDTNSRTN